MQTVEMSELPNRYFSDESATNRTAERYKRSAYRVRELTPTE
jgi:hypothetical protein